MYWDANATSVLTIRVLRSATTVTVHIRCLCSMLMSNGTTEASAIVTRETVSMYISTYSNRAGHILL